MTGSSPILADDQASEQAKLQAQQHRLEEGWARGGKLAQLEQHGNKNKVVVENTDIPQIGKDIPDTLTSHFNSEGLRQSL